MSTRRQRGFETEELVAAFLRAHGFPHAEPPTRGAGGPDILGTPGVVLEVKAKAKAEIGDWLAQARNRVQEPDDIAAVIWRRNGDGPTTLAQWPVIIDVGTLVFLLAQAGYGDGAL